jgi:hypothetical protein
MPQLEKQVCGGSGRIISLRHFLAKNLSKDSDPQTSLNPDPISDPDEQTWL